jgi:hypothetical protein
LTLLKCDHKQYLFFNRASILPQLSSHGHADGAYLHYHLKEGIIKNQSDIYSISNHIKEELLNRTLHRLEKSNAFSSVELISILEKEKLNASQVPELLFKAKKGPFPFAAKLLMS